MRAQEVLNLAEERMRAGEAVELVRIEAVHGSTPRSDAALMLVTAGGESFGTVGGGAAEGRAQTEALALLKAEADGRRVYLLGQQEAADLGMVCGGDMELSFQYLGADERGYGRLAELRATAEAARASVYLFGGGHVAEALAGLLHGLDFRVIVYDDRDSFVGAERFPMAEQWIAAPYTELTEHVQPGPGDYGVVITRGHSFDYEVTRRLLELGLEYIGVIGSRAKMKVVEGKLRADGFEEAQLSGLYTPVGIQIGAETPEEIAVSIAAELILVRARREKRKKVRQGRVIDWPVRGQMQH